MSARGRDSLGLLKSRKEATGELERYVDAVEHAGARRRRRGRVPRPRRRRRPGHALDRGTPGPGRGPQRADQRGHGRGGDGAAREPGGGCRGAVPTRTDARRGARGPRLLTAEQLVEALDGQAEAGQRLGEYLVANGMLTSVTSPGCSPSSSGSRWWTCATSSPTWPRRLLSPSCRPASGAPWSCARTDFGYDVVVADPSDPAIAERLREVAAPARQALRRRRRRDLRVRSTSPTAPPPTSDEHVRVFEARRGAAPRRPGPRRPRSVDEKAPVVQVVNLMLAQAVSERASDVHIEPMADRVRIRNRDRRRAARGPARCPGTWARRS